jgi:hypothetical protein
LATTFYFASQGFVEFNLAEVKCQLPCVFQRQPDLVATDYQTIIVNNQTYFEVVEGVHFQFDGRIMIRLGSTFAVIGAATFKVIALSARPRLHPPCLIC